MLAASGLPPLPSRLDNTQHLLGVEVVGWDLTLHLGRMTEPASLGAICLCWNAYDVLSVILIDESNFDRELLDGTCDLVIRWDASHPEDQFLSGIHRRVEDIHQLQIGGLKGVVESVVVDSHAGEYSRSMPIRLLFSVFLAYEVVKAIHGFLNGQLTDRVDHRLSLLLPEIPDRVADGLLPFLELLPAFND